MIETRVIGQREIAAAFQSLDRWLADMRRPLEAAEGYLTNVMVPEQFGSEGGRTGGWPDPSLAYAAQKAKDFPGAGKERRTGALEESLENRAAPGAIFEVTNDSLRRGSDLEYAFAQHHGIRDMPAHDLFGYTDTDGDQMISIIRDDLADYMRSVGFEVH